MPREHTRRKTGGLVQYIAKSQIKTGGPVARRLGWPFMAIRLSISPEGRISLPAAIRAGLGVECGGTLIVEEVENGVLLRSATQVIVQAQTINRKHFPDNTAVSVDAFPAARIRDSGE